MKMNKKTPSAKSLLFHERVFITILVLSVLGVFLLMVGIFVPFFQDRVMSNLAMRKMDETIVNCINASYGYGSSENVISDGNENIIVFIVDNDGTTVFPKNYKDEEVLSLFEKEKEENLFLKGRKNEILNGYCISVMDSDYVEENLAIEKSTEIVTKPIDVPDEAVIYSFIDKKSEIASSRSFSLVLSIVFSVGFVSMIPIVYFVSGRVMKPTRDTIRHEKEFVANASHELKTPLAIITAEAGLLKGKTPENSEYINNIILQCKNMNDTILDMISLSKLEIGAAVEETVDFSSLVMNLCLSFDSVAFERGIDYSYDIQKGVILQKKDKKNLTRLVNLLIDNAMKYAEDQKIISISLKMNKKEAVFKVYNTGCQVLDEDREKVFERFYQGKSGADNERKGSGLGLAIVKQICETYDFKISITSHYHRDMLFTIVMKL